MSSNNLFDKINATINAYVKGFSDQSLDGICDLYDDNATVEDPYGTPRKKGMQQIREFYRTALVANPTLEIIRLPTIVNNFSATHLRATVEITNNTIVIDLISVMSYNDDGKIVSMTAHFDPASINA